MRAFVTILAVLVLAVGVSADQATYSGKADSALSATPGTGAGLGDGINPMIGAAANNCADVMDLGVLPQPGLWGIGGDTTGAGDDFDYGTSACTDMGAGQGGLDEIWGFSVGVNSYWTFVTCYAGYAYASFDTSLQVNDGSGGCPGVEVACNGDGAGCPGWTSAIDEVFLMGGVQYYLIVDGWSSGTYGTYTLIFGWLRDACTQDADCDDGLACNGAETCSPDGECLPGEPACLPYQTCEEPDGICIDPDPCLVWLAGDRGGFGPQFIWGGNQAGMKFADDVELEMHGATRELISYSFGWEGYVHWGIEDEGFPYTIDSSLYLTEYISCFPWLAYPGTECTFANTIKPSGTVWGNHLCEPNGGLPTGIELPDNSGIFDNCEIDFWMVAWCDTLGAGHNTSASSKYIGELGFEDEIGQDVFARETLDEFGDIIPDAWTLGAWSNGIADFGTGTVCVVPAGGCCYDEGGCTEGTEAACIAAGGTYLGDNSMSDAVACADEDPDGDGFFGACDNCPAVVNPAQLDCNDDGEGDACEPADEQDADGDGVCNGVDGCPNDPAKTAPGQCGCGNPDTDSDFDGVANCLDECPMNPIWQTEPACGCASTPYDNGDDDGDGFENCFDTCAGVDDAEFGPCDDAIPTVSEWGLVIMALLLLAAGKVYFGRRPELG